MSKRVQYLHGYLGKANELDGELLVINKQLSQLYSRTLKEEADAFKKATERATTEVEAEEAEEEQEAVQDEQKADKEAKEASAEEKQEESSSEVEEASEEQQERQEEAEIETEKAAEDAKIKSQPAEDPLPPPPQEPLMTEQVKRAIIGALNKHIQELN